MPRQYALQSYTRGWRIAIGLQVAPAALIVLFGARLPRSPRWLVQQGDMDGARASLRALRGADVAQADIDDEAAAIGAAFREEQVFGRSRAR